jgi:PPOX class probable F420-dependent enzyme
MTFDDPSIQQFLATKDVIVLATVGADGAPLATPMWFLHDPAAVTMISVDATQKVRNLRRDPRVYVVGEAGTRGDVRGVALRGRAEFLSDSPERRALTTRLLDKYHPDLERLWGGRAMPANRVMFRIVPAHVHAWGLDRGCAV